MSKFKVMIVKKDGLPIAVRAAEINGRVICIALKDTPEPMNWCDAVECGIPSKSEWLAISENIKSVSRVLKKYGGEPLDDWYWSSSESYGYDYAWVVRPSDGDMNYSSKSYNHNRVRCVLAF